MLLDHDRGVHGWAKFVGEKVTHVCADLLDNVAIDVRIVQYFIESFVVELVQQFLRIVREQARAVGEGSDQDLIAQLVGSLVDALGRRHRRSSQNRPRQ